MIIGRSGARLSVRPSDTKMIWESWESCLFDVELRLLPYRSIIVINAIYYGLDGNGSRTDSLFDEGEQRSFSAGSDVFLEMEGLVFDFLLCFQVDEPAGPGYGFDGPGPVISDHDRGPVLTFRPVIGRFHPIDEFAVAIGIVHSGALNPWVETVADLHVRR